MNLWETMTGSDITREWNAAFCDDLIKDSPTYADIYQESIRGKAGK